MNALTFRLLKRVVLAPGLCTDEALAAWAQSGAQALPTDQTLSYTKRLPMMKARRMSDGTRLACEAALALDAVNQAEAWIFTSRHGEAARGTKILTALSEGEPVSPTDFMMSVHNAAAGMFTIETGTHVMSTSIAAGDGSFHAGLLEAAALLAADCRCVTLVDYEGSLPALPADSFRETQRTGIHATAWLLARDGETGPDSPGIRLTVSTETGKQSPLHPVPPSLQLATGLMRGSDFSTVSTDSVFVWHQH